MDSGGGGGDGGESVATMAPLFHVRFLQHCEHQTEQSCEKRHGLCVSAAAFPCPPSGTAWCFHECAKRENKIMIDVEVGRSFSTESKRTIGRSLDAHVNFVDSVRPGDNRALFNRSIHRALFPVHSISFSSISPTAYYFSPHHSTSDSSAEHGNPAAPDKFPSARLIITI